MDNVVEIESLGWNQLEELQDLKIYTKRFRKPSFLKLYEYENFYRVFCNLNGEERKASFLSKEFAIKYCKLFIEEEASTPYFRKESENRKALYYAKYIVNYCYKEKGLPITVLDLQRILFELQKEFIKKNTLLFYDDFEVWKFGPCIPEVYYYFCGFGAMPICENYNIQLEDSCKKPINNFLDNLDGKYTWEWEESKAWKLLLDKEGVNSIIDKNLIKWEISIENEF